MTPCSEHQDSIALLVDGELSPDAATGVRGHLAGCSGCAAHVRELESLISQLTPDAPAGMTVEESRFWRRFDADLAVRVARGETPFWKQSISLPFPFAAAGLATLLLLGVATVRVHARAERLAERGAQLEASLKVLQEDSLFGASAVAAGPSERRFPAQEASAQVRLAPSAAPMPEARSRSNSKSDMQIRFIDSEGVLQPGDLY